MQEGSLFPGTEEVRLILHAFGKSRFTVAGFIIFIVASIAWMVDGWLETKA
jgi:hypothetical protein